MSDENKNPFQGFHAVKARDGVAMEDKPAAPAKTPDPAPQQEEEHDPLAAFRDQGDDGDEGVSDDDDGAGDEHGDDDAGEGDEGHEDGGSEEDGEEDGEEDEVRSEARRLAEGMAKRRIAELTKFRRSAEAEAERLRRENEELRSKATPAEKPKGEQQEETPSDDVVVRNIKGEVLNDPDPKKYRYGEVDSQYLKDVVNYQTAYARAVVQREADQSRQAEAAEAQLQELRTGWTTTMERGRSSYDDFDTVVLEAGDRGDYPLTKTTFEIAATSEFGADVLYHLATNPATAAKVSGMNDRDQARYLGRLEAAIETSRKGRADKGKQQQRAAPGANPPPSRPAPRGRGGKFVNPAKSSNFADFEAAVNRHEGRNKR